MYKSKRKLNKDRLAVLILSIGLIISITGNLIQNISFEKADKIMHQTLEEARTVEIYEEKMTVNELKDKYMIVVDELHDLQEKGK